jgi:hypothetical protein
MDKSDTIKTIEKTNRGSFSTIPYHQLESRTRIPASALNAQKECALPKNHRMTAHDIAARDGARVSSSNS